MGKEDVQTIQRVKKMYKTIQWVKKMYRQYNG
jgi:hypothetical protein